MREQIKQLLKNSVYRAIGETAKGIGVVNGDDRSLRVLMYHKVNDLPGNRMSMPVSPFDDGYRDNLENAAPVLHKHGYPAVQFVPLAYVGDRQPLPHEEHLASHGVINRTVDWEELGELEALGVRIESHGISHRPLADLELDESAREIAISKLRLEDRLGRPVRAFSYVKGSEAHYKQVHLSLVRQAGYDVAFTAVSGANTPSSDPLQLRRYSVEPYSARTFELVLAGACDLISLKDTVTGTHARRIFNAALGTSTK